MLSTTSSHSTLAQSPYLETLRTVVTEKVPTIHPGMIVSDAQFEEDLGIDVFGKLFDDIVAGLTERIEKTDVGINAEDLQLELQTELEDFINAEPERQTVGYFLDCVTSAVTYA